MTKILSRLKMRTKILFITISGVLIVAILLYALFYLTNKRMLEDKINVISDEAVEQARVYMDSEFGHLIQLIHGGIIGHDINISISNYLEEQDAISYSNIQEMLTQFVVQSNLLYSAQLVIEDTIISNLSKKVSYDIYPLLDNVPDNGSLYFHDTVIIDQDGHLLLPLIFEFSILSAANGALPPQTVYCVFNLRYDFLLDILGDLESNIFGVVRLLNTQGEPLYQDNIQVQDYDYVQFAELEISGWSIQTLQSDEILFSEFYEMQRFVQYLFAVMLALYILFIFYVVRNITTPLNQITAMAERMQHQDYSTKLAVQGKDEIAKLGNTFVQLQDELILYNQIVEEDKIRIKQEEAEKRHIEMRLLQEQMNPHFLYNTLDSIYWYSLGGESKEVCSAIVNLSQMLRISLSKGDEFISLEHEVQHLESYLIIQKQVFGDKFNYEICFDKELRTEKIIKIILQPLVENSIIHGFADFEQDGMIWVNIFCEEDTLVLQVLDNGVGFENTVNKIGKKYNGSGFALDTLKKRLELHYHNNAYVKHMRTQDDLTLVEIRIKNRGAHA